MYAGRLGSVGCDPSVNALSVIPDGCRHATCREDRQYRVGGMSSSSSALRRCYVLDHGSDVSVDFAWLIELTSNVVLDNDEDSVDPHGCEARCDTDPRYVDESAAVVA